ncbi:S-adenosylmethionine:tRNA ribosyltransferase-isomerase [Bacillus salitolerans]|uniref:S-adenosylmethionine:tRNA ribosyltransferase-isomerase n=1 Tax=Bacillus salitolerans TaxID=1437434 RepID=A0ABW4LST9_9BACI
MTLANEQFEIPTTQSANIPIELTGKSRDSVRMMVLDRKTGQFSNHHFNELDSFLQPGDVVVLNNSRTIPAVLKGKQGKREVEIRLSRRVSAQTWEALIVGGIYSNTKCIEFSNEVTATIEGQGSERPLVVLSFSVGGADFYQFIYKYGEPIRYEYIEHPWPLEAYQTVYASVPGSVEMPSAGRAFTWQLLNRLKKKGIEVVILQLHAGLSYYGNDRWPNPTNHPEAFHIPLHTAKVINQAKKDRRRIIAVGTTVVRAIETVADDNGHVRSGEGTTRLYIKAGMKLKAIDGLITGLHEPEASHLDLLTSLIEKKKLIHAYEAALKQGYLWHEFGDMNLILPIEV